MGDPTAGRTLARDGGRLGESASDGAVEAAAIGVRAAVEEIGA